MSFFKELRDRRLVRIVVAFAAAGWVVMEVLNSLTERGILPETAYRIGFVWYLGGIGASLVVGWYHGEKGRQQVSPPEVALLGIIAVATLVISGARVGDHLQQVRVAEARESGPPLSRVAVLYFEQTDATDSTSWLGDAFTEALTDQLQRVEALDVVSANAVLPFRGAGASPDSVGRLLEVGTVIAGVVEETDRMVRIRLRLLEGSSGTELASTTLERPRDEVLGAMDATVQEVAQLFRQRLGEEVRLREVTEGTRDLEAWRALQHAEKLRKDARLLAAAGDPSAGAVAARADSLLASAERLDGTWIEPPRIRAQLAVDRVQEVHTPEERARWVQEGVAHADRVLALDPDDARGLELRGTLRFFAHLAHLAHDAREHEALLREAREDLERAVRLDRSLASAQATLSILYYQPGIADLPAAALAARQAYEGDAYLRTADDIVDRLFWTNLDMGQFSQARRWCDEGRRRFPGDSRFLRCQLWLMTSPGAAPDVDQAWAIQRELSDLDHGVGATEGIRGRMLLAGALGRASEGAGGGARSTLLADSARRVLESAHDEYLRIDDPRRELMSVEAFAWVILGDFDRAIERWKVYASLNHGFQASGDISWRWRELREHPRFQEVVTQGSAHREP